VRPWGTDLRTVTAPAPVAAVRTGVGVVMLLAPSVLPQVLGVDAAARARTSWLVQMLGVREVALAAGVLAAGRSGGASGGTRSWALAGSACDVVDALVVGSAARRGAVHPQWGGAVAVSALAAGLAGLLHASRR
jgi:hypothetical protein